MSKTERQPQSPPQRLFIFDTTLRDGEQSPGASMNCDDKVRIARMLEKLKVDVIEAGFAIASEGDFEAVKRVAETVRDCVVCSLARARPKDIERAAEALAPARAPRIHTFIATSPLHMQHKLRMTPEQTFEAAVDAVRLARKHADDVEFSCEDASRSDFDFLCRVVEAAIANGASTINLPDTVGYGVPEEFGLLFKRLREAVPNADQAVFSTHCHNDLGLAAANSLSAVRHGARQIECTINGLGERAGNAALEEIVMATHTRRDVYGVETRIDTRQIVPTSRLVASTIGFPVQPNKAVVGANAFAHESGIHQDGVLKHRETYEIMQAEQLGWSSNQLVLGKHSGRAAFRERLERLGIVVEDAEEMEQAFQRFKSLADKKHEIFDDDLQALTRGLGDGPTHRFELVDVAVSSGNGKPPRAEVAIRDAGHLRTTTCEGSGPVDAVLKAIAEQTQIEAEMQLYLVNAISGGTDAQGEVTVRLAQNGRIVNGSGADTDIILASAKAYVNAINLLDAPQREVHPQRGV